MPKIDQLKSEIESCERCPRLTRYRQAVAKKKRKAYAEETYWGRPVAGFGDPHARLVIVGLAPAAHGANRTGRIFTGDQSGLWLYRALHKAGFASHPESRSRDDGLRLMDAFVSCVVRCAPPDNKPLPLELTRCGSYLDQELKLLSSARVYLALGQIAFTVLCNKLGPHLSGQAKPKFSHGAVVPLPEGRWLLMSYHPSQQNTFTKRLTEPMFDEVFNAAQSLIDSN